MVRVLQEHGYLDSVAMSELWRGFDRGCDPESILRHKVQAVYLQYCGAHDHPNN